MSRFFSYLCHKQIYQHILHRYHGIRRNRLQNNAARGDWQRQDVVFEMNEGSFARKICVTFFNKPEDVARLKEGAAYTVSVNIESREYNGRWYTDIRAWRIQPKQAESAAPMPDMPPIPEEPSYASSPAEVDDLPF